MKRFLCILACVWLVSLASVDATNPSSLNVVILGDSNTWIGGDDCSRPKGWNTWFVREFSPSTCRSYARSGATWSHTSLTKENPKENIGVIGDDNVITNQIIRLQQAVTAGVQKRPDLIIIAAGTNDLMFPRKRPNALDGKDKGEKSVVGAIAADCRRLHQSFPAARIVIMTPIQCVKFENDKLHALSDAMAALAGECKFDVIRMDCNGAVRRGDELKKKVNTYDGIHTSETGARFNGKYVADQIKNMLIGGHSQSKK